MKLAITLALKLAIILLPTAILVVTVTIRPTHGASDILAYTLLWAMSTLCAAGFILPTPARDEDGLDIPEVLRVLPPVEPSDEWDRDAS